jgi:hypothetical protein
MAKVSLRWHSLAITTVEDCSMGTEEFDVLQGRDDAIYRTLGVLVRHLHVKGLIEAPVLVREIRLVAAQIDTAHPSHQACIAGMQEIAQSFEDSQPGWSEERAIRDLYRADPDTGQ